MDFCASMKRGFFRPGKAVEGLCGGVAALRRTRDPEDLRSQGGKRPLHLVAYPVVWSLFCYGHIMYMGFLQARSSDADETSLLLKFLDRGATGVAHA